ncbi:MAG: hypothetical protein U0Y10_26770 [Spirosomataceae bacterium]
MKTKYTSIVLWLAAMGLALSSCTDHCQQTITYRTAQQSTITIAELRTGVKNLSAQTLEKPGKIYSKDNYLFINEIKKGIHILDNSDPSNPKMLSFLAIPGNIDMAVKGNILYADSYTDVIAFDISNPTAIKEVNRVTDVFQYGLIDGLGWYYNPASSTITDQSWDLVTSSYEVSCDEASFIYNNGPIPLANAFADKSSSPGNTSGTGGSMARFTIANNYLYTVSNQDLQLFDIKTASNPVKGAKINLGWGIETIFPYKDKLFIGSNTGMHIFDNSTPSNPVKLSTFQHVMACDPVVVNDNMAYVTLRTGTTCARGSNELDVVNISNPSAPYLMKSYPMQNPHGLGIDFPTMFLCEGKYGLKAFNINDPMAIDKNQLAHFSNLNAYDVIPLSGTLLMIGADGLYQYDYRDPKNLKLLSVIPVVTKSTK